MEAFHSDIHDWALYLLRLQARHNLFPGDRMFPDSDSAGIVNGVRYCAWYATDRGFSHAFYSEEPAWLQAVDEDLCLFRNIHDCREPIGQIANAVVTGAWKFPIVRNRVRRHLSALDQRSFHIAFSQQRVDDIADVRAIGRS
jgi:hypothetical protein